MKNYLKKLSIAFLFMGMSVASTILADVASFQKAQSVVDNLEENVKGINFSGMDGKSIYSFVQQACYSGKGGLNLGDFQKITVFFLFNQALLTAKMPKVLTEFMFESIHVIADLIQQHFQSGSFCQELASQLVAFKNRLLDIIKRFLMLPVTVLQSSDNKRAEIASTVLDKQTEEFLEISKYNNLVAYIIKALPNSVKAEGELIKKVERALRLIIANKIKKYLTLQEMMNLKNFFVSGTYTKIIQNYEKILEDAFQQMPASKQLADAVQCAYAKAATGA